ncbi:hypothetical protein SuNHUV7_32880 (plasmid) [Pseudoseohaeicola sp. NH-UV-7]|uniref:hypothetical protein n=1 Tax=Sulfitobacter sp. TBRI5 TaxID=2989732 RepID=UPI003A5EC563
MSEITIIDRPCGTGKTTDLIQSLADKNKFLIVTPYLDEVQRIVRDAPQGVCIETPSDDKMSKLESIRELLSKGANIATTHALYVNLAEVARNGLLAGYEIIIDEVPNPIEVTEGVSAADFKDVLLRDEYVTVDETTGQVRLTMKWQLLVKGGATGFFRNVYQDALANRLFTDEEGNLFVLAVPTDLLTAGTSLTILTYLAEGSLIKAYLERCKLTYTLNTWEGEAEWRKKARSLITIEVFNVPSDIKLSHAKQTARKQSNDGQRISDAIKKLFQRKWSGVAKENTVLTCAAVNWFADGSLSRQKAGPWASRSFGKWAQEDGVWQVMNGINWLANTTRGSNRYIHCSHAIYLYDQHPKPQIKAYLGRSDQAFSDAFALTELVQWLWRTRVRAGLPITVAIPSERMRYLLTNWLQTGEVSRKRDFVRKWQAEQSKSRPKRL